MPDTAMQPDGFHFPDGGSVEDTIGWQVYIPVSLRERDPLWLRQIVGKCEPTAPPAPVGDVVIRTLIHSFDEIANVLVLEATVNQTFSFVDAVNIDEWIYHDIDVSSYCDADTTHFWITVARDGTNIADTLEHHCYYYNGRTLIEEDEP